MADLTPLSFHILLALSDGVRHGYGIGKAVEERSAGRLTPRTGSLYQGLRRLEDAGYVRPAPPPRREDGRDERRQFFAITPTGRAAVRAEARHLAQLVEAAGERGLL